MRRARMNWRLLPLVALALQAAPVRAHDVRGSVIQLDVGERTLELELELPRAQLELALGHSVARDAILTPAEARAVGDYVREHLHAQPRAGHALRTTIGDVSLVPAPEGDLLRVRATMVPRQADRRDASAHEDSVRWIALRCDAILHRVVSHNIYVFVRRDLANALLGDQPELAGMLHYQQRMLVVDRTGGTWWRGFTALFTLGLRHIREGTDHLLFLLLLLLPAPLVAERKRWGGAVGARRSLLQTGKIVTAFTLGHSLTLVLGALWGAELPAAPVEIAIALSILVSAVHALWPLFAGREALVAGSFGLVHGLAFATVLSGFGFDGTSLAVSVLGFNLGVEAMQLAIIALVMPWLAFASRSPHYRFLRVFGAGFGFVAAAGWLAERAFGLHTRVPDAVEAVAARAPWLGVALVLIALLCNLQVADRRSPR